MLGLQFVTMLALLVTPSHLFPMSLTYCDGAGQLIRLTSDECPYGINFGSEKPPCVCINGVYRLWMEQCVVYDGFMNGGCTTLSQGDMTVDGIRLAGEIESMEKSTVAILGERETDYQIWKTFDIGSRTRTFTDNFYVLNGRALFGLDGDSGHICVERIQRPKFCRYFRDEQNVTWKYMKEIEVRVQESCGSTSGHLIENNCYETILPEDSECSLECVPEAAMATNTVSLDLNREATMTLAMAIENQPLDDIPIGTGIADSLHSPLSAQIATNSLWSNRQLNHYSRLRQVKLAKKPNFDGSGDNFLLLQIMQRITSKSCPASFVSPDFLERALDLFWILHHQGQRSRGQGTSLTERNFEWIRQILAKCNAEVQPLPLYTDSSVQGCDEAEYVQGACLPVSGSNRSDCSRKRLTLSQEHSNFKFHYVIDSVWLMVDLVHIACFPHFESSYRMFHAWQQSMEKLFTREIRNFWFNPGVSSTREYQSILGATAVTDIFNLEMCVESAYLMNPVLSRLIRPKPTKAHKTRRSVNADTFRSSQKVDVTCRKEEKDFKYPC